MSRIGIGIGNSQPLPGIVRSGLVAEYRFDKRNLLTYSEQSEQWVAMRTTVTPNSITAPDGNLTADTMIGTDTTLGAWRRQDPIFINGITYTLSCYAKAGTENLFRLDIYDSIADRYGLFDLNAGTVTGSGDGATTQIQAVGDGWYRCLVTAVAGANATGQVQVRFANATVTTSSTIYLWGAQLERSSVATLYEKTTDNQALTDFSGHNNTGLLGSTTGADTNDPTWDGQGLSFSTDDYVKLSYMINVEQDFTVYIAAEVGATVPIEGEVYWSFGNSVNDAPRGYLYRHPDGNMYLGMYNNAAVGVGNPYTPGVPGKRLYKVMRYAGLLTLKDIISNNTSSAVTCPSPPITINQMALGARRQNTASLYLNQPEYFAAFYSRATTNAEDAQNYHAIKTILAKRGIVLP